MQFKLVTSHPIPNVYSERINKKGNSISLQFIEHHKAFQLFCHL